MRVLILLSFLFLGCASTEIRDPNGKVVFRTYADATNISYSGPGYSFYADKLTHSTPTRALGSVVGTAGSAFAVSGIGALFRP